MESHCGRGFLLRGSPPSTQTVCPEPASLGRPVLEEPETKKLKAQWQQ